MSTANGHLRIVLLARQETSPYFTYQKLASIFNAAGHDARVADAPAGGKEADLVITHNTNGFENNALNELAKQGVRVVTFIDTPLNKFEFLRSLDPGVTLVFTDPSYIPLAKQITQGKNRIVDHPLEITLQEHGAAKPIAERSIDVLFVGRLVTFGTVNEYSSLERRLAKKVVGRALHATDRQVHELAMDAFRPYKKLGLYRREFLSEHFLQYCWKLTHALRRERRLHVLDELKAAERDVKLAFVSNDEAHLKKTFDARHRFYGFMPWSEVVALMGDAKLVINTMPAHLDCLHEHLVEAMYSGAVCLTDENRRTKAVFTNEKDVLTFGYGAGELARVIRKHAHDDTKLQAIADAGRQKISGLVNDAAWLSLPGKVPGE